MEIIASAIREEKEIKQIHIRKEEARLSLSPGDMMLDMGNPKLSPGDMMLYMGNPKDATRKLLELISGFSKFADTKLIYRNLLHFYTPAINYQREKLKKQFHLPSHQKEYNT